MSAHSPEPSPVTPTPTENTSEHPFLEIVRFALLAIIIVLPIRMFVAQPFIVSGASMDDTFHNGEYLIVDQLTYQFESPERGEVVVFRYPGDPKKFFIKRVIGVPGDTLTIDGDAVTIQNDEHPTGSRLQEPYIATMSGSGRIVEQLGEGEYFVMGDNRDYSSDSRAWGILTEDRIIGRAFVRLFPVTELEAFPGAYDGDALLAE
ncbi:MAG TPA: signal peptidase I [Candidatus Paceibacterota bacterium]|nr:signal peptidase I [Candidatus Paceibacterota bacterium]